ncbi:MAG: 50S ribosomal protein L21 [Patescibacteria group bacterium]|nr:50S ribosomal protein L21 [Patescibacteria group bacterium]
MKAVIRTGGKQYFVSEGDVLTIERLENKDGDKVIFKEVLLVADEKGKDVKIGKPLVEGAKVEAELIENLKGDKIKVFKMKRRKRYRRTQGHRQQLSHIKITKITA